MEKNNMYPNVTEQPGVPNGPPSYNQTYATAPAAEMASSFSGPTPMQPPQQQQQPQQHFIVQQQPQAIIYQTQPPIPPLGPHPCPVTCPNCREQRLTNVIMETSTKTHLIAAVICIIGCIVGCCCFACIPYFVDSCKNPTHYCSNCNAYLGTYNK